MHNTAERASELGVIVVDPRRAHAVRFMNQTVEHAIGYSMLMRALSVFDMFEDFDFAPDFLDREHPILSGAFQLHCRDARIHEIDATIVFHFDRENRLDFYIITMEMAEILADLDAMMVN